MHAMLRHFHLEPARCCAGGGHRWQQVRLACKQCPSPAPPRSVDALLTSSKDLVAGGAALHAYMGQPPASFAGDLDIFCSEGTTNRWRQLLEVRTFCARWGHGHAQCAGGARAGACC